MHVLTILVRITLALIVVGIPTAVLVAFHRAGKARIRRAYDLEVAHRAADLTAGNAVRVLPAQRTR